jgi:hypothetical protein
VKREGKGRRQSAGDSIRMRLETLGLQSDSNRFSRSTDKDNNMATEGCRYAVGKNLKLMSTTERGKELANIKARMEELELRMKQNTKPRWVYEWPMRKPKINWPVKELMDRR